MVWYNTDFFNTRIVISLVHTSRHDGHGVRCAMVLVNAFPADSWAWHDWSLYCSAVVEMNVWTCA